MKFYYAAEKPDKVWIWPTSPAEHVFVAKLGLGLELTKGMEEDLLRAFKVWEQTNKLPSWEELGVKQNNNQKGERA